MSDDKELIARLRSADLYNAQHYERDPLHKQAADRIEALTEQLAAARQDAKAAEDELEMQEQEACMMENDYIKLEKERDALEAKLAECEARLGKAVEALKNMCLEFRQADLPYGSAAYAKARTTLAEIKSGVATVAQIEGESHE